VSKVLIATRSDIADLISDWETEAIKPTKFSFLGSTGPTGFTDQEEQESLSIFLKLFPETLISTIVAETNRYSMQQVRFNLNVVTPNFSTFQRIVLGATPWH